MYFNIAGSPNIIGATGGSGTRVVARIVQMGGMFIGTNLNVAEDAIDIALYVDCWINIFMAHRESSIPPAIETKMNQELNAVLARHLACLDANRSTQHWGWKVPRSIFLLPFFHSQFPKMKFLHLVRDGRDMAFSANQYQLIKYGKTLLTPLERDFIQPLQSIALWSRLNLLTAEYGEQHMPDQYLRIRFEDLCFEPVYTINRIFNFLCLTGDIEKIAQSQVSPPPSIERWRSQNKIIIQLIDKLGRQALQKFGYLSNF